MARTEKIQVQLDFLANTNAAQASLQKLGQSMNNLMHISPGGLGITREIDQAQMASVKLKTALQQAVNVNTGQLDLSRFNNSLQQSGTSLRQLRNQLTAAGPEGSRVFMNLAQSIVNAEVPARRMNATLASFASTLKNVVKWQISSTLLSGVTSTISEAYQYAQDLNRSLNDIRIVTGYNADAMEKFALQANKAARALSASTTEYTKASLIYFQQGLDDKAVTERTNATIKMSKVTGEAAEDVSSYMTAIWNNFDDGTQSLESYADAITALGAATASSTEEIADGLQKFSAISKTIGLSYEYATAALATVVAQTRESADTVGTAFKTIFARLESLELGETLDDDTTLTQYSAALAKVGVNIKDANGDLKDMDIILDELGAKWDNISKAQQVALARTVAGLRQYNNFIALLDNYDTFKVNVGIADDSEGTLEEQFKTYEESWQAASDRVKASAEAIYASLLDDDFFIKLLDGLEKTLSFLDRIMESAGGLKGILFGLSAILTRTFNEQISAGMVNMAYNLRNLTGAGREAALATKREAASMLDRYAPRGGEVSPTEASEIEYMQKKVNLQMEYNELESQLTSNQKLIYKNTIEQLDALQKIHQAKVQAVEDARAEREEAKKLSEIIKVRPNRVTKNQDGKVINSVQAAEDFEKKYDESITSSRNRLDAIRGGVPNDLTGSELTMSNIDKVIEETEKSSEAWAQDLLTKLNKIKEEFASTGDGGRALNQIDDAIEKAEKASVAEAGEQFKNDVRNAKTVKNGSLYTNNEIKDLDNYIDKKSKLNLVERQEQLSKQRLDEGLEKNGRSYQQAKMSAEDYAKSATSLISAVSSLGFAISSISSLINTLKDPDASPWEKFSSALMSVSMILPMLASGFGALREARLKDTLTALSHNIVLKKGNKLKKEDIGLTKEQKIAGDGNAKANTAEAITQEAENKALEEEQRIKGTGTGKGTETGKGAGAGKGGFSSIAPALGQIALILAGIAIAITSIVVIYNYFNKEAKALEKQEKFLKTTKENTSRLKGEYDNIKSSIESLSSKRKDLDQLAKGTTEWREAVAELNAESIELINTYEELAGKYKMIDGVITFDEGALEEAQANALQKYQLAQSNQAIAQANTYAAQNELSSVQAQRKHLKASGWSSDDTASIHGGGGVGAGVGLAAGAGLALAGVKVGALAGAWLGPIGAAIGAALGLVIGGVVAAATNDAEDKEAEFLDKISGVSQENRDAVFAAAASKDKTALEAALKDANIDINDDKLLNSLIENSDELKELTDEMALNNELIKVQNTNAMMSYLSSGAAGAEVTDAYMKSNYQTEIASILGNGNINQERYEEELKKLKDQDKSDWEDWWDGGGVTADKDLAQEYAAAMGYEFLSYKSGGAGKGTISYRDADGNTQTVTIEDDIMREQLARSRAQEGVAEDYTIDLENALNSIETSVEKQMRNRQTTAKGGELIAQALTRGVAGSSDAFSGLNVGLLNKVDKEDISAAIKQLSDNDFKAIYGDEKTRDQVLKEITDQLDNAKEVWDNKLAEYSSSTQRFIDNLAKHATGTLSEVSDATFMDMAKGYDQILAVGGMDAFNIVSENVTKLLDTHKGYAIEITSVFANLDWSKPDEALAQLELGLLDYGIVVDTANWTTKDLQKTLGELDLSNKFLFNLDTAIQKFRTLSELIDKLSFGTILSDEEYKSLMEQAPELAEYFIDTFEGKRFIGTQAQAIAVEKAKQEAVKKENQASINAKQEALKAGEGVDWDYLSKSGSDSEIIGTAVSMYANWSDEALQGIGISRDLLDQAINEKNYDKLKEYMSNSAKLIADGLQTEQRTQDALVASSYTSLESLQQAYLQGLFGVGEYATYLYEKQKKYIEQLDLLSRKTIRDGLSSYYDFALSRIEDGSFKQAERVEIYVKKIQNAIHSAEEYESKINDFGDKFNVTFGENDSLTDKISALLATKDQWTQEDHAVLNEITAGYQDLMSIIEESEKQMYESLVSHFEEIGEAVDKVADGAKRVTSVVDHYQNIADLAGEGLVKLNQDTINLMNNAKKQAVTVNLEAAKQGLDVLKENRKTLLEEAEAAGETETETFKAALAEIDAEIAESEENFYTSWEEALTLVSEIFENTVSKLIKDFGEKIAGGVYKSTAELKEAFEQQSVLGDQYLKDYEAIYKLTKLTRNIEKSINDSASIKSKTSLKNLQAEIVELQNSGKELSDYDIEYLNKKYELTQAQAALEESQDNKKTVRLQRDASGSWSYVYTQDVDKTSEALSKYEDKLYELQEFNDEYLQETGEKIVTVMDEYQQAMEELAKRQDLSVAEKQEKMTQLTEYYQKQLAYYTSEYDKTIENNNELYEEDWANYDRITDNKIDRCHDFANSFSTSVLGTLTTGSTSAADIYKTFVDAVGSTGADGSSSGLLGSLNTAVNDYTQTVSGIFESAGSSINEYEQDVEESVGTYSSDGGGILGDLYKMYDQFKQDPNISYDGTGFSNLMDKIIDGWKLDIDSILLEWQSALDEVNKMREEMGEPPNTSNTVVGNKDADFVEKVLSAEREIKSKYKSGAEYSNGEHIGTFSDLKTAVNAKWEQSNGAIERYSEANYNYLSEYLASMEREPHQEDNYSAAVTEMENRIRQSYQNGNIYYKGNKINNIDLALQKIYREDYHGLEQGSKEHFEILTNMYNDMTSAGKKYEILNTGHINGKNIVQLADDRLWYALSPIQKVGGILNGKEITGLDSSKRSQLIPLKIKPIPQYAQQTYENQIQVIPLDSYKIDETTGQVWNTHSNIEYLSPTDFGDGLTPLDVLNGNGFKYYKTELGLIPDWYVELFDTGGYTGSWGPEGRLAMLHQKEIVLNADDTSNLLASVSLIRDITKQIDLQAAAAASGLGSLSVRGIGSGASTLQQDVVIHAEFPNATDRYEIEEAFNTLINRASQYTNRK